MADLPPAASLIAWLILTHHRLPCPKYNSECDALRSTSLFSFKELADLIYANYGYENKEQDEQRQICFNFSQGLLSQSQLWLKQLQRWSLKLLQELNNIQMVMDKSNGCWRVILLHSRLSLMLGDHYYSSQDADQKWKTPLSLFANTDRKTKKFKQALDEHLYGVAKNALRINYLLPLFETELPLAHNIKALRKLSPKPYHWQDKAVKSIKAWREHLPESSPIEKTGFFTINMASTGCGKTFANAKVMQALSEDLNSLRYVLALGLRTLTLQTGDEYREKIGLNDSELAVLIGSKAIQKLHQRNKDSLTKHCFRRYQTKGF